MKRQLGVLIVLCLAFPLAACGVPGLAAPTSTPPPTATPAPTATPIPTATATPLPPATAPPTKAPPTPTDTATDANPDNPPISYAASATVGARPAGTMACVVELLYPQGQEAKYGPIADALVASLQAVKA